MEPRAVDLHLVLLTGVDISTFLELFADDSKELAPEERDESVRLVVFAASSATLEECDQALLVDWDWRAAMTP
jgi:hypothetical protein